MFEKVAKALFLCWIIVHISTYLGFVLSSSLFQFFWITLVVMLSAVIMRKDTHSDVGAKQTNKPLLKFSRNQITFFVLMIIYAVVNLIYCHSIVQHASYYDGRYTEMLTIHGERVYNEISKSEYLRRLPFEVRLFSGIALVFNLLLLGLLHIDPVTKKTKDVE